MKSLQKQKPFKGLSEAEKLRVYALGLASPKFFCEFFLSAWFRSELQWYQLGIIAILTRRVSFLENLSERDLDKILRHFVWKEDLNDDQSPEHPIFFWEEEVATTTSASFSRKTVSAPLQTAVAKEVLGGAELSAAVSPPGSAPSHASSAAPGAKGCKKLKMVLRKCTLLMVPRGFGKTTIVNASILYAVCYGECKLPVYISESGNHAETQLRAVKSQIESNALLHEVFGILRPNQRSGAKWTENVAECTNGTTLAARGRGAQIRGLLLSGYRPDRIVVDDVEDEESVRTHEQRLKVRDWGYGSLMPALEDLNENSTITAIGTLLHSESFLMVLRGSKEFNTVVLSCIDRDGDALWPAKLSLEEIEEKKQSYARAGMLSRFYLEFFNELRPDELQKFRNEYIIYKPGQALSEMRKALALDPAISERKESDFCAFGLVGMNDRGIHHVIEVFLERGMTPREQIDKYFDLSKLYWPVHKHGIETTAYQRALVHLMQEEMHTKNHYFEITPLSYTTDKVLRVEGILQPRYANGYIVHCRRFPIYESQLTDWPNGKRDGPDVVSMAISLLDPYAGQAIARNGPNVLEFKPVEDSVGGDWRIAV